MIDSAVPVVVNREVIGRGRTWDDRVFEIVATDHDRAWPGHGESLTFSVEILQGKEPNQKPASYGFFYQEEAFRFCTCLKMQKTQYSESGEHYQIVVDGLGLPDALIARYAFNLN